MVNKKKKVQGPVRPGTDERVFRDTGVSQPKLQSPAIPGITFTPPSSSPSITRRGGGGGSSPNQTLAPIQSTPKLQSTPPSQILQTPKTNNVQQNLIQRQIQNRALVLRRGSASRNNIVNRDRLNPFSTSSTEKRIIESQTQRERLRGAQERGGRTIKGQLALAGFTSRQTIDEYLIGLRQLPSAIIGLRQLPSATKELVKNPSNIKRIPKAVVESIKESVGETIKLARVSPTEAVAKVGTDYLLLRGTGEAFKVVGKVSSKATQTRLNPFFNKIDDAGKLRVTSSTGKKLTLQTGFIGKGTPLSKQVGFAGKTPKAITSVQADRLTGLISKERVIRKPIPGEAKLPSNTKKLLKKFDNGKIKPKELIRLNRQIRAKTGKSLLERSLFADPTGKLRVSRLPRDLPEARLRDLLTKKGREGITFKEAKPEIALFTGEAVEKFPKELRSIVSKLKKNKRLTLAEQDRLVKFQLKQSGKFKPIGDTIYKGGKELEVTIAPGETIRRVKKIGSTSVDGKKIRITEYKIIKPTKKTRSLLKKYNSNKINKRELKILEKRLKKETGIKQRLTRVPRRTKTAKRVLRPRSVVRGISSRVVATRRGKATRRATSPKSITRTRRTTQSRPTPRSQLRKRPTTTTMARNTRASSRIRASSVTPRSRVGKRALVRRRATSNKKTLLRIKRKRTAENIKQKDKLKAYNVFARPLKKTKKGKQPKLIKVTKKPVSKSRAEDIRNYLLDTSLARTGSIKATKGKPTAPRLKVPVGYAKKTNKKFREFRIVKGKRKSITPNKVIEKRKNLLDTKQEKKKITLRARIRQLSKPIKRKVVKKKVVKKRRK